jgi:hypothetical protein
MLRYPELPRRFHRSIRKRGLRLRSAAARLSKGGIIIVSTRNILSAAITVCLAGATVSACAIQTWKVTGGATTISFFDFKVNNNSLKTTIRSTADPQADMEHAVGFRLRSETDLVFNTQNGAFRGFVSGQVVNSGGFDMVSSKGKLSVNDFCIDMTDIGGGDIRLTLHAGKSRTSAPYFTLEQYKIKNDYFRRTLIFGYANLVLTPEGASKLGMPGLAGECVGMITVSGTSEFIGGDKDEYVAPPAPEYHGNGSTSDYPNGNIQLFAMQDCGSYGRVAPANTTNANTVGGYGVGTTSCGVGSENTEWYQRMDTRHPVIGQNMYRKRTVNGSDRFEQIGAGWVKHGFTSTNSPGCGSCPGGAGTNLVVGCSDTYGSSLNASRTWLGPRNEVNPFTGWWTCTNSYFSNYQNNCNQNYSTSNLDSIAHMMKVVDSDLTTSSSNYYYEAYYISHDDVDRYNNATWKSTVPSWNGSSYQFTQGSTIQGVAIQGWSGALISTAQPTTEGDAIVASKVTNLGGGIYHYEYAVYVHSLDRQIRSFSVPVPDSLNLTNVEFRDVDEPISCRVSAGANSATQSFYSTTGLKAGMNLYFATANTVRTISSVPSSTQVIFTAAVTTTTNENCVANGPRADGVGYNDATNDWTFSRSGGVATWQTQTYAQNPNANALSWGYLFNFRFDADAPQVDASATMNLFKPGVLTDLTAAIKAPGSNTVVVAPNSVNVAPGIIIAGGLSELATSDDSRMTCRPGAVFVNSQFPVTMTVEGILAVQTPSVLKFKVEAQCTSTNVNQRIQMYNFSTSQYDDMDLRACTVSDQVVEVTAANPGNYVEPVTKRVVATVSFKAYAAIFAYPWIGGVDQAVWTVTP